jgi:hypothetical protein
MQPDRGLLQHLKSIAILLNRSPLNDFRLAGDSGLPAGSASRAQRDVGARLERIRML